MLWDAEQSDRHPSRSLGRCIASQSLCPGEPRMGTLCAGKGCRLDSQARRSGRPDLDLDALIAQELDTGASVDSTTPVLPEERRIPNDKRMEQDAHLARLARFAPLPLALLAQRAGAATANAGSIHHAQASISFSAVFVRNQLLVSRAPKRPIELASKVLAGKAACFPRRVAVVGGPYPDAGAEEAGRVGACELPDGRAGANSVVRTGIGSNWCPSSSRIFQTHWLMICQASCPQAAWLHQRSGSCSLSSSANAGSKAPRCKYSSTTSQAVNARCGRVVKKSSYTTPARVTPTGLFFLPEGCVATMTRYRAPSGPTGICGQS